MNQSRLCGRRICAITGSMCEVVQPRIKCDSPASFIPQQCCLWFILSPAKHNGQILTAGLRKNLMHLKSKGRGSGLPSCTWTCAPDGMVLFASCILSKAPKSVSYVQEGLLDCSVCAFSFHMIVSTSFSTHHSTWCFFSLDLSGFKNPSERNMNLESHTVKTEN